MVMSSLDMCCWDNVLCFLDIRTCGRLSSVSKDIRDSLDGYWKSQCKLMYGQGRMNYEAPSCHKVAKDFVRRAVLLKVFAQRNVKLLEVHWCYPFILSHTPSPVQISPTATLFETVNQYDFYLRLRFENGSQVHEQFCPSSTVHSTHNEICLQFLQPITWPALSHVQEHFDIRDFEGTSVSSRAGSALIRSAWDRTSVVVVGSSESIPAQHTVVAAAFSFMSYGAPPGITPIDNTLDFVNHYPGMIDDGTCPRCTIDYDRYWSFCHVEWNDDPLLCDYEVGFVARRDSLVSLIIKKI